MYEQVLIEIARNTPSAVALMIVFKWVLDLFNNHLSKSIEVQSTMVSALRELIEEVKALRRR